MWESLLKIERECIIQASKSHTNLLCTNPRSTRNAKNVRIRDIILCDDFCAMRVMNLIESEQTIKLVVLLRTAYSIVGTYLPILRFSDLSRAKLCHII
jgi:hypothetical protein